MKTAKPSAWLVLALVFAGCLNTNAQDAAGILNKMDNILFSPKDKQANMKIVTTSKSESQKIREAVLYQKGPEKKLYRYTQPKSQAGIATLSLPGDVMWLYMPAFEKPKKISMLAKSQAFNGTDFAWEDIPTKPYADRYKAKVLKVEGNAYILELTPLSEKSNYSKIIARIESKNYYPLKMEYFDKSGLKVKEAVYTYTKVGGYWNASEVVMTDLKKGSSTKITMSDVKFDQGLGDDIFTVEKLKMP